MKRILSLALAAALLLAFAGCGGPPYVLEITGDCEGYEVEAKKMPLEGAVALSQPRASKFDLLLIGGDGLTARIPGGDLTGCTLVYSKEYAWELRSEYHPPSANIKNLADIVVVSASEDPRAARFASGSEVRSLTAGQLLLCDSLLTLREEGTSHIHGRSVTVYTMHRRVPLAELCPEGEYFRAMGLDGSTARFRGTENCFLEGGGNQINLLLPDGQVIEGLAEVTAEEQGD